MPDSSDASKTPNGANRAAKRAAWIGGIVVVAVIGYWVGSPGGVDPSDPRGARQPGDPAAGVAPTPRGPGPAGWTIRSGETLAISRSELGTEAAVTVDLALNAPEPPGGVLQGRILAFDESRENRERPLRARVAGETRERGRVELPVDFLTPGLYLIEFRTSERTALPLVRYRLEIR